MSEIKNVKKGINNTKKMRARNAFKQAYYPQVPNAPYGPAVPSAVNTSLHYIDKQMPSHKELGIPEHVPKTMFLTLKRITDIAFRNSEDLATVRCKCGEMVEPVVECQSCGEKHTISIPNYRLEKNEIEALKLLIGRMWGQMANITADINIKGQIDTIAVNVVQCIVKYVPKEKIDDCVNEISEIIKSSQEQQENAITENLAGLTGIREENTFGS
jgi:hypothetical protein